MTNPGVAHPLCLSRAHKMPDRPAKSHAQRSHVTHGFNLARELANQRAASAPQPSHAPHRMPSASRQRCVRRSGDRPRIRQRCGCRGTWLAHATLPDRGPACAARLGRRCSDCPSGSHASAVRRGTARGPRCSRGRNGSRLVARVLEPRTPRAQQADELGRVGRLGAQGIARPRQVLKRRWHFRLQ